MKIKLYPDIKYFERLSPCLIFNNKIKHYIEYYGDDINSVCNKYHNTVKIILGLILIILVLGVLKFNLLLFSAIPLSILAYIYPLMYTWSKKEEHKRIVNSEAPFIALIAYVDSLVDKGLQHTFKELSEIKELKVPKIELEFLQKMTTYMNKSFLKAVEKRSIIHKEDLLGKLYSNYLVALNLGITVRERLKDVLKEMLMDLRDSYKGYLEKSAELTELEFSIFLLLPIILIGFSFTFKVSIIELLLPLLFVPPLLFLISMVQPNSDYNIRYGKYIYILLAIPLVLLIPKLNLEYKIFALISILVIFSYFVYSELSLGRELESFLPILLKEVSEYLKIGYTIQNAVPKVKLPSKRITKVIEDAVKDPLSVNTPSRLFNITFKLLFIIARTGYSSTAIEELASSINEIIYSKNNLVRQLRLFDAMVVLTPVMLWMTFVMLGKITPSSIPSLSIISAYSIASSIIFSKISRFTILYFPTFLLMVLTLGILSVLPPIFL